MNYKLFRVGIVFLLTVSSPLYAASSKTGLPPLECDIGPLTKSYAHTEWKVYSCRDNRTLVIIAAPANPAAPFHFSFYFKDGSYHLSGDGTGNKEITDVVYDELIKFSDDAVKELIAETRSRK